MRPLPPRLASLPNMMAWFLAFSHRPSSGLWVLYFHSSAFYVITRGSITSACIGRKRTITYKRFRNITSRIIGLGWSSSRRQFGRSDRCRECESKEDMHSAKQTRARAECCRPMIRRKEEGGTERWLVQGRDLNGSSQKSDDGLSALPFLSAAIRRLSELSCIMFHGYYGHLQGVFVMDLNGRRGRAFAALMYCKFFQGYFRSGGWLGH